MFLGSGVVKVTVGTGGSGYASPPTVALAGGGGTGATAVAQMAGTVVQAVVIGNAGTGYTSSPTVSFSGGGGTGAAATATVLSYAGTRPLTMFKGRFNDLYGVDGYGRGFRWDGETPQLEPLGITKPDAFSAPTASGTGNLYVSAVQIIDGGAGYNQPPTAAFTGGGATTQATAAVQIKNGRVSGVTLTGRGTGYTSSPLLTFSGGQGTSAAFTVNVKGYVSGILVTSGGAGYTGTPTLTFGNTQGLTGANVLVSVDADDGVVLGGEVLAAGTGATTTGITAALTGGGATTQAQVTPVITYTVHAISVANSGTGYLVPPVITIVPDAADPGGGGASAQCAIDTDGRITGVTVLSGGQFSIPPTAIIADSGAKAMATVRNALKGLYKCAIRYLDDTPESQGGPIPSSISELQDVDCSAGYAQLTWALNNHAMESRVHAIELWRTTADQAVALYRVARIDKVGGVLPNTAYVDTLTDADLLDVTRDTTSSNTSSKYGFMPIVLPSGALNARRFDPPPTNMAVACMFQDRAWYAVDTTGAKPNSLYYSEVDEPESVPESNELVVQENVPDSDAIAALIPLGSSLLLAQHRHIYKLTYVAQPLFDAAIQLVSYRGVLNSRCWDVFAGVAFAADDYGLYAFDGGREDAISAPIDDYWRDGIIDFSKSKYFYVKVSPQERVVRFFYCRATDGTYPRRALCFSLATQAWWEEEFAQALPHACVAQASGQQRVLYGGEAGAFLKSGGLVDATTSGGAQAVAYQYRSPPMALVNEKGARSVSVLYTPTAGTHSLNLGLHYNNSSSPRANAVATDRGGGFTTATGSTVATLNLAAARSPLGDATGQATAHFAGRVDERSAGADRHVAIAFSGAQQSDAVRLHAVTIEGVS